MPTTTKFEYWLDGNGWQGGSKLPPVWVCSRKIYSKYSDNYASGNTPDEALDSTWKFKFSTRREAGTVGYMISKYLYLHATFGVPMPEQFEVFSAGYEEQATLMKCMKRFAAYEKYVPLYEKKWLGEVNETHDK